MSTDESSPLAITALELTTCVKVLSKFAANDGYPSIESTEFDSIRPIIHNLYHIERRLNRQTRKVKRVENNLIDQKAKNKCLLRSGRAKKRRQLQLENVLVPDGIVESKPSTIDDQPSTSTPSRLIQSISCYICKLQYRTLHFFYDRLCPACAKLNYEKRLQTTDLSNHVALVTGGRVKIGYRITLKLLRANCFVISTSRFPRDFLDRLIKENDYEQWKDRVHIYGVDFRYAKLVELFCDMLIEKYDKLDFLINNACQTIQRPKEYYQHLIHHERLTNYALLPNDQQNILEGNLQFYQRLVPFSNQLEYTSSVLSLPSTDNSLQPLIKFDVNHQPLDLRSTNSWTLRLADISANEINEVLTINTLAPFILNSKLKTLMTDRHPNPDSIKFIINVSAMEGSFSRANKTDRHPHTNAAKAALNMMTRTSARDYQRSNIYMVSVDTGWINDENPVDKAMKIMTDRDFQTPLDEEDAAARVLDPIINTYRQISEGKTTNLHIPYGCFLKDYSVCNW